MSDPITAADVLTVSDTAAEKIKQFLAAEKKGPEAGLRLGVQGGGCSGMTYFMEFDTPMEGDLVIEKGGVKVFVDPRSASYVKGSTLEYVESLTGAGFKVTNPNVKGSCGCGHSFNT